MKVFLDMDGVLVDFVGHICLAHGRENPYLNPANNGLYYMERSKEFEGMPLSVFYGPCANEDWWASAPKTKEADAFVDAALSIAGGIDNVAVLTANTHHVGPCATGKYRWLKEHYRKIGLHDRLIVARAKGMLSGPHSALVDDHEKNTSQFDHGILVPRPWNKRWQEECDFDLLAELRAARSGMGL